MALLPASAQTGLLIPSSSCQEESSPIFPPSLFCLPPLGSNPTFSLCGSGAGWSSLCSAPAHVAVLGSSRVKAKVEEPVLEEMGLPTWDSGCYPGLVCPSSCLARCLQTSLMICWSRADQSMAPEDPEGAQSTHPTPDQQTVRALTSPGSTEIRSQWYQSDHFFGHFL